MIYSTVIAKYVAATEKTGLDLSSVDLKELSQKIGSQLGEVEWSKDFGARFDGVVVAKVVSCEKHPNADKLSLCLVDDGGATEGLDRNKDGLVQVVCGAPNVRAGIYSPWVVPGIAVPATADDDEPFVVGSKELRGEMSNGMLASPRELGINDDHSTILELTPEIVDESLIKPGQPFRELLSLDDQLIDIENKMFTRRPDLFGNLGISREVAGILGQQFKTPDWYITPLTIEASESGSAVVLDNQVKDKVPRFTTAVVEGIKIGPSPLWIQAYLKRVGINSVNNVVDMTNLMSMYTAQPTHAFDYDKITARSASDASLGVRMAKKDEKLTVIGGKTLTLTDQDMVITTDQEAVALAGIMGGADTEVDENTTTILLECATFDMYTIRRSSMRHGLFTDASTRYTKGQTSHHNQHVVMKLIQMLQKQMNCTLVRYQEDSADTLPQNDMIATTAGFINARLGTDLGAEQIATMLRNIEFAVEQSQDLLKVTAPSWRMDIHIAEDLVEEIGRFHGYDNLPLSLPSRSTSPVVNDPLLAAKARIRHTLASVGANEALTYSFVHGDLLTRAGQDPQLSYAIKNAISPELQYYRQSVVPSLLDKVYSNIRAGYGEFALFEISRVHSKHLERNEEDVPTEIETMGFVCTSKKPLDSGATYFRARRYLDRLASEFGQTLTYVPYDKEMGLAVTKPFAVGRSAVVKMGDSILGIVGEITPKVRRGFKLSVSTAGFELDVAQFAVIISGSPYEKLLEYPKSSNDMTFTLDKKIAYGDLHKAVSATLDNTDLWHHIDPVSIYSDNVTTKNITLRIVLADRARTLKSEDVNSVFKHIAEAAKKELGATISE